MSDSFTPSSSEPADPTVFRGPRRGERAAPEPSAEAPSAEAGAFGEGDLPDDAPVQDGDGSTAPESPADAAALSGAAEALAAERLGDLQRLQAEYVNYRRRVERDAAATRELALAAVLEALLPVLDDIALARQHGDLDAGPFSAIADKLAATTARLGLESYGEPGEVFDPALHDALMQSVDDGAPAGSDPVVGQVLQPGYRMTGASGRTLRAARVAVVSPA